MTVGNHAQRAPCGNRAGVGLLGACLVGGLLSTVWISEARADEDDATTSVLPVEVHGFVSQGFIESTANNYLANSKDGSFQFSEVGINFTKTLTDRMRMGIQLFTHDLGPLGNYRTRFDWFYLDY